MNEPVRVDKESLDVGVASQAAVLRPPIISVVHGKINPSVSGAGIDMTHGSDREALNITHPHAGALFHPTRASAVRFEDGIVSAGERYRRRPCRQ